MKQTFLRFGTRMAGIVAFFAAGPMVVAGSITYIELPNTVRRGQTQVRAIHAENVTEAINKVVHERTKAEAKESELSAAHTGSTNAASEHEIKDRSDLAHVHAGAASFLNEAGAGGAHGSSAGHSQSSSGPSGAGTRHHEDIETLLSESEPRPLVKDRQVIVLPLETPEPNTLVLLGTGLLGLAAYGRRRGRIGSRNVQVVAARRRP